MKVQPFDKSLHHTVNSMRIHSIFVNLSMVFGIVVFVSCKPASPPENTPSIEGTWELLSETKIEKADTTFTPAAKSQRMIKIINRTHFSFLRHDLNMGKDSTAMYVAGGGTYNLTGNKYTEHLQFLNLREWENHDFSFDIEIRNDTLIQKGQEKVEGTDIDRYIIEKYLRTSK